MKLILFTILLTSYVFHGTLAYSYWRDTETKVTCNVSEPLVTCKAVCSICDCTNTTINCRSKGIKSSFSTEIKDWKLNDSVTTLESIDLRENFIGRIVMLPSLPIKRINFAHNVISSIDFSAFYRLTKIEEIDLSHNQLTSYDLVASKFRGSYSSIYYEPMPLKSLNLSNNIFRSLTSDTFEHLVFLERLSLSRNPLGPQIDHSTVIALASVTKLKFLDLSFTELTSLPAFLQNLPDLRELVLSNNNFIQLPTEGLSHAKALQILHLDETLINAFTTKNPFPEMPTLEQLHVSYMHHLTRIEKKSLQGLTGLKYLFCHNNIILSTISADALSSENIIELDFHDNHLRTLPEGLVKNWKNVQVDIRGNVISCDCDNQWMLLKILPQMDEKTDGLTCASPTQMIGTSIHKLASTKYEMRCLDYYNNHPEKDGTFMIATFVIVILALVSLGVYFLLRNRKCSRKRDIDYRAIYQQNVEEDNDNKF